jgi:hypothetical protein
MTKLAYAGAAFLLAATLVGCVSSQRFSVPAPTSQRISAPAPQTEPSWTGGPYTREREDREFGQPME